MCHRRVTSVAFGDYSALGDKLGSSTVTTKCSKGTNWSYYQYSAYYGYIGLTVAAMLKATSKLYYQTQVSDGSWDNDVDKPGEANFGHCLGTGHNQIVKL